jgi:hypothetical protein
MKIIADLDGGKLILPGAEYPVSNNVRTFRDGTRKSHDVIRTIPGDMPYDPQPFPKGTWKITGVDWQKDKGFNYGTYGPVKIRTDAWQWVGVWKLDEEGDYLKETAQLVKDTCYWLHYSDSRTTLGCIRLASPEDAIAIGNIIAQILPREDVLLEVV